MGKHDYEQLVFMQDEETGLKAITCIHDTTLGPSLGGTRYWTYEKEGRCCSRMHSDWRAA
ncbi:MAG: hypothetical protein U5K84_06140 [Alkalibacterium sp.]|nr:hypothetical protein [Alkalibacterium sp.]